MDSGRGRGHGAAARARRAHRRAGRRGSRSLAPGRGRGIRRRQDGESRGAPDGDPRRLAPESVDPIRAVRPEIERWVEQVEALGLPDSLVHNDLHAHNVFDTDAGLRFFDFGDALLMQPLAALFIPLHVLAHRLEAPVGDARLWTVADAALEVWSDVAPLSELRAALPAALQLGRLGRVESWARVCATMTPEELDEDGDAASFWLGMLRLDPPTGWTPGGS